MLKIIDERQMFMQHNGVPEEKMFEQAIDVNGIVNKYTSARLHSNADQDT